MADAVIPFIPKIDIPTPVQPPSSETIMFAFNTWVSAAVDNTGKLPELRKDYYFNRPITSFMMLATVRSQYTELTPKIFTSISYSDTIIINDYQTGIYVVASFGLNSNNSLYIKIIRTDDNTQNNYGAGILGNIIAIVNGQGAMFNT